MRVGWTSCSRRTVSSIVVTEEGRGERRIAGCNGRDCFQASPAMAEISGKRAKVLQGGVINPTSARFRWQEFSNLRIFGYVACQEHREMTDNERQRCEAATAESGTGAFCMECFRPVAPGAVNDPDGPPFYETYGYQRVESGVYVQTLRYAQHVKPQVASPLEWAAEGVHP
jgi:hypothetical protein